MSNTTATVEHVAPSSIVIEDNVREAVELPRAFVASIKRQGVLVPVLAVRGENGTIRVRDGQRRTLAAVEAGIDTMPAYIVPEGDSAAERIVAQIVTNDHRDSLTDADRAAGFHALALEGLSVQAIASATGHKRATVSNAVKVSENDTARAKLASGAVTLDEALIFTEFEGDEDALEQLDRAVKRGDVEYTAERIRTDRRQAAIIAAATAPLVDAGVRLLTNEEAWDATRLERLATLVDDKPQPITPDVHVSCAGHAAVVNIGYGRDEATVTFYCTTPAQHVDRYTGEPVTGKRSGPMTDDEKAERRTLIANNKAWATTVTVRRDWLATFLARKAMPKDAALFAARILADRLAPSDWAVTRMGCDLLGIEERRDVLAAVGEQPARAMHALVALAIAAVEAKTDKGTWRYPQPEHAVYFGQLATWGYPLSDVERIAAGIDPEQAGE